MTPFIKNISIAILLFFTVSVFGNSVGDTISVLKSDTNTIVDEVSLVSEEDIPVLTDTSSKVEVFFDVESDFLTGDPKFVSIIDSLLSARFFSDPFLKFDSVEYNTYNFSLDEVPTYHDTVYEQRIEFLNKQTPIELTYNREVKNYINLYAVKKRKLTSKMLGLAEVYFPMFEESLDKYDMPLEIKYLAIVESALNPAAGSHKGAKGLWQFMYGTGKVYGLKVTSLVDDRYDPYKSTIAACEHLQDLYDIYSDWSLALAAYNSGAGNVNRAIRRAGGTKNYWAVWPFLPRETRGYVPAFIAVNYVMNYAPEHNIYPMNPGTYYHDIDTVSVNDVLAFDQLNEMLGIPMDELKFLNPHFKRQIIPATNEKPYTLRIPRSYTNAYLSRETELYAYKTKKGIEREKLLAEVQKVKDRNIHIVRSGENLGLIAKRYHVYVNQIKSWNNLRSNTIYPGQKLVLYGSGSSNYYKSSTPVKRSSEKSSHVVKNGENLGLIAKKYKCTVTDLKEWNNLKSSNIYPNQKLIVYKPEAKKSSTVKDGKYMYHIIRKGDTLWDIAKEYDGVTVDQIKSLNNIKNSKRLVPGQKIKISLIS